MKTLDTKIFLVPCGSNEIEETTISKHIAKQIDREFNEYTSFENYVKRNKLKSSEISDETIDKYITEAFDYIMNQIPDDPDFFWSREEAKEFAKYVIENN